MGCDCNGCHICEPGWWEYRAGRWTPKQGYREARERNYMRYHSTFCNQPAMECKLHLYIFSAIGPGPAPA